MTQGPKLKVLMPRIAGQRFSCHSCAGCCRDTVVPLTADDLGRIEAQEWSQMIDVEPAVRMDDGWALNKRRDGSCVFLDEAGLCRIHARHGPKSKPAACRLFPLSIRPEAGGRWRAWLRFDCPSVARSQGRDLSEQFEEVARLVRQLGRREGGGAGNPEFRRGMAIGPRSIDAMIETCDRWFEDDRRSWRLRIGGALRATERLASIGAAPDVQNVRGCMRNAFEEAPVLSAHGIREANHRQRRMLRELVFAHCDSTSFSQLQAGWHPPLMQTWRLFRTALRFRRGTGQVPPLKGIAGGIRFADVESVLPAERDARSIDDLLTRYVRSRLQSRTFFGSGFHGWPVLDGLRGLWGAVAVTAWVSRWIAAGSSRSELSLEDVVQAIGVVDAGTSQLPAKRRLTARLRIEYLSHEDGLLRLIQSYPFIAPSRQGTADAPETDEHDERGGAGLRPCARSAHSRRKERYTL